MAKSQLNALYYLKLIFTKQSSHRHLTNDVSLPDVRKDVLLIMLCAEQFESTEETESDRAKMPPISNTIRQIFYLIAFWNERIIFFAKRRNWKWISLFFSSWGSHSTDFVYPDFCWWGPYLPHYFIFLLATENLKT